MRLKNLFRMLKRCQHIKKDYYTKWKIETSIDTSFYIFAFIPTVVFVPWVHREIGGHIFELCWLNCTIGIGEWCRKQSD